MDGKSIAVLMVEDNPDDARLIRRMLAQTRENFSLEWVDRLSSGLKRIAQGGIDLVLLDLGLPESSGLDTLRRLQQGAPSSIAVLVLSGHGDEEIGVQSVQEGAQDYLVKGQIDGRLLVRAMRYAVHRQEAEEALRKERADLERQVRERTANLASLVESLEKEIAERRRAEQMLMEAEAKYRCLVEESLVGVYLIQHGSFVYVNERMAQIFGYPPEELCGCPIEMLVAPEDISKVDSNVHRREIGEVQSIQYTFRGLRKDGLIIEVEVLGSSTIYNGAPAVLGSLLDVTERKRSEQALRRLNRELRAISNCNERLMRARDEQTLLEDICRIVCEDADYRMAWVGFAENDPAKTVRPVAWAGFENDYLQDVRISWGEDSEGGGAAGVAIRSGRSDCIQDFAVDPRAACWRQEALRRGYRSSISLPLKDEGERVYGAFIIYSTQPNAFTPEEVRLLEELAGDLAFGIAVLRARIEREQALEKIRHLASIVECSNDAIFAKDLEGTILSWNRGAERVYGYSAEEVIGQSVDILLAPNLQPDLSEHLAQISRGEQLENIETQRVRKDGQIIEVALTVSPLRNSKGEIVGASTIARDITQRKRAEQQLRALNEELERRVADRTRELRLKTAFLEAQSNSTIDGILVIDPEGHKLFQNRRCIEMFQVPTEFAEDPRDDRQFLWVSERVRDPEHFRQRVLWLYSHPEEEGREEIELKDGTILERYSAPVIGSGGTYYGRIWNFRDITERKRTQQQLEEALKKEIVLRREVHHRVKNNLQVIISLLYLQSTRVDDPIALALLRESQVRVHSIAIVHEMLYQREDLSQICFADYVQQLSADLFIAYRVSQRDIQLKIRAEGIFLDLQKAIPCGIIVTELMTNALKYAFRPGNPGELCVCLERGANGLVLSVQDDGVGLPKDLDVRRAQTMGLSLVRDLSRQLGGGVEFKVAPCGHGTLTEIVFPDGLVA